MSKKEKGGLTTIKLRWPSSIPLDHLSVEFLQGMVDRMAFGYHNYGHSRIGFQNPGNHSTMKCMELRHKEFKRTKNTEFLMDEANYCMLEHMYHQTPGAFFRATTKEESPGSPRKDGRIVHGKEDDPDVQAAVAVRKRIYKS